MDQDVDLVAFAAFLMRRQKIRQGLEVRVHTFSSVSLPCFRFAVTGSLDEAKAEREVGDLKRVITTVFKEKEFQENQTRIGEIVDDFFSCTF